MNNGTSHATGILCENVVSTKNYHFMHGRSKDIICIYKEAYGLSSLHFKVLKWLLNDKNLNISMTNDSVRFYYFFGVYRIIQHSGL